MTIECTALCPNCIPHDDGSQTCLGMDDPQCKYGFRLPANDYDADVSVEVFYCNPSEKNWEEFQIFLDIPPTPTEALIRLLKSPAPWDE